jgi:outer membrane protein OmpA-like peptidoglycan-associated protein
MPLLRMKPDELLGGVKLATNQPHRIVVAPDVVCAVLSGMFFSTNKDFLLPGTFDSIRQVRALYEAFPQGKVLIVGHTDTTSTPEVNDPLSLRRARAVEAYLKDDVDTWYARYDSSVPSEQRWGQLEDDAMLSQARGFVPRSDRAAALRTFQQSRGLNASGVADQATRKQLIKEYMDQDGTSLPSDVEVTTHGCGENFPLSEDGGELDEHAADGVESAANRRVEVFFFSKEKGIDPPVPGDNSAKGSSEYPAWRKQAFEHVFGVDMAELHLVLKRPDGEALAAARYQLAAGDQVLAVGATGPDGRLQHIIEGGHTSLTLTLIDRAQPIALELGALRSLKSGNGVAGAQGRLLNMRAAIPALSGTLDDPTRDALLAFQRECGVEETGQVDDPTKAELVRRYGC